MGKDAGGVNTNTENQIVIERVDLMRQRAYLIQQLNHLDDMLELPRTVPQKSVRRLKARGNQRSAQTSPLHDD